MATVLIIDQMHESIIPLLKSINYNVDYQPNINKEEVYKIIENYEGLIIRSKLKVDKKLILSGKKLQFIARAGAGLDQIDEDLLKERNITLLNAPEGNRIAVGEHTLGMLLSLFNKLHTANQEVRQGIWEREANRGFEISGKTIGIIGYGNMGKSFAKCLAGFDCKVLAYDKYLESYGNEYAEESSLENIFEQADVLSLHIPLTQDSKMMINQTFINSFKKPFWLINTARGEIVNTTDLVSSLISKKILGAGLDVLENEKLNTLNIQQKEDFNALINMHNVILTPHVAGWTFESYEKINKVLCEKIYLLNK